MKTLFILPIVVLLAVSIYLFRTTKEDCIKKGKDYYETKNLGLFLLFIDFIFIMIYIIASSI